MWRVTEAEGIRIANAADLHGEVRYRVMGRLFGYPECCIDQFVSDFTAGILPGAERGSTAGGWVPCARCWSPQINPSSLDKSLGGV